jgi:pimeloyl-ACP methyl ester carboxylesterase
VSPDTTGAPSIGRRFVRWSVAGALTASVLAYATAIGWLMANEVALVFVPNRKAYAVAPEMAARLERVTRTLPGGRPGLLWVLRHSPEGDAPWVIFLHGNGANVATPDNVTRYRQMLELGLNVVAPEYPGFGTIAGEASETAAVAAARDAWDWLRGSGVPAAHIVIYGWSLGSGVATHLAAAVDERALVLEGAFTGVDDRASELYPWLPIRLMIRNAFASRDRIARVGSPLLLLHARDDEIIPFAHGEQLLNAAREPKRLVALQGGHVRPNLRDQARYLGALRQFLGEALAPRALAPPLTLTPPPTTSSSLPSGTPQSP